MVEEKKRGKIYLIYTLMFLAMCVAAFYPFYAEGKGFIWGAGVEDGLSQHFSALSYYGRWLREAAGNILSGNFDLPMWDMSIGYRAERTECEKRENQYFESHPAYKIESAAYHCYRRN